MENWTKEWPKEPGVYWFYGWCFKSRSNPAKHYFVEAKKTGNGVALITSGHFLYKEEGTEGVWCKAILPEPPQDFSS